MTNSIEELEDAECILVTGSNTTETHPVIATYIKRAVIFKGAKLIVVDPREIELSKYAHISLKPKNGTDVAWINGMMHVIWKEGLIKKDFIDERTEGFEEILPLIEKYTPEKVEEITGIPKEDLIEAARIYGRAERASIVYAMGITQHITGTDNVLSLANLALMTGNVGKPSTGVNPLRGQNNVQGACDMGCLPNVLPGYVRVDDEAGRRRFEEFYGVRLPEKPGLTVTEMMKAASQGKVKAMYIVGENPILTDPNIQHVEEALRNLEFLVVQDIFLTETAKYAHLVLPSASFAEKEGTFTNTERRVLPVRPAFEPLNGSKTDFEIISLLSEALGYKMAVKSPMDALKEINSLVPAYGGITYERLNSGERIQWPCPKVDHQGTKFLHKDTFVRGKGKFHPVDFIPPDEWPDEAYPFLLSTGRIIFHYHTGSMTRKVDSLNLFAPLPFLEMNEKDMKRLGLDDGETALVVSRRGKVTIRVAKSERVQEGSVFLPFHFSEAAANILTNDAIDPVSKIPEYKVCAVRIEKL